MATSTTFNQRRGAGFEPLGVEDPEGGDTNTLSGRRRPIVRTDVGAAAGWRLYWVIGVGVAISTLVLVILLYIMSCQLLNDAVVISDQVGSLNTTCADPCTSACPNFNVTCPTPCSDVNEICDDPCVAPCPDITVNCTDPCTAVPDPCVDVNITCPALPDTQPIEDPSCDDGDVCTQNLLTPDGCCKNPGQLVGTDCYHECFANGSTPTCSAHGDCRGPGCLGNCNNTQGAGGVPMPEDCPLATFDNSSGLIADTATVCSIQHVCRYYAFLKIFSVGYTITDDCPDSPEAEQLCATVLDPATEFKNCLHGQHTCLTGEVGGGGEPAGQILVCRWIWKCATPRLGFIGDFE